MSAVGCSVQWCAPLRGAETLLHARERERWEAYRQAGDRDRFATGRWLARRLAGAELGVDPATVTIDARCEDCGREHGRPVVPGASFALSIAHSGQRVVAALARGAAVGVDVEMVRPPGELLDPGARVLTAAERARLQAVSEHDRPAAFMELWTRKEAVLKALRLGLRVSPDALGIDGLQVVRWPADVPPRPVGLHPLDLGSDHVACVAVLTAGEVTVEVVDASDAFPCVTSSSRASASTVAAGGRAMQ